MKRVLSAVLLVCFLTGVSAAQTVKVKIRAALYDRDLNLKPVPHLVVRLVPTAAGAQEITLQTTLGGLAESELPAGTYRVITDKPVEMFDKTYRWEFEVALTRLENALELSNDNAKLAPLAGDRGARVDELAYQYKRVKNAVVTVQTEFASHDGFILDRSGLVLTVASPLEHVTWLAVQVDDQHKLPAVVVATDKVNDLAVIRISADVAGPVTTAELSTDPGALIEGERVFVVENPGSDKDRKLHTGVISRADATEIVSDVAIHDIGCPLFNSSGSVVGVTRAKYKIQPIANARTVIAEAKEKLASASAPAARLLPTAPSEQFPEDHLRAPARDHWEKDVYSFKTDDFFVELLTPVSQYETATENYQRELKEYSRHPKGATAPSEPEHKYDAVLMIAVVPKTKVPFWENMAQPSYPYRKTVVRYKTGFSKLRLLCGDKEVEPIWPGHVTEESQEGTYAVLVDESSGGRYIYPHDAVSPKCGNVTLQLFSTKDPNRPIEKVLNPSQVQRIWQDFDAFRQLQSKKTDTAER